ncbi:HEPN domain-containing protein [Streptomyces erythrochromogenes]
MKLQKAEEFLLVAQTALSADCYDAAVSLAVSAAINGADALCLAVLGTYSTAASHNEALALVRRCGVAGTSVSRHLQKALKLKTKAQYSSSVCSQREAQETCTQAERVLGTVKNWIDQNRR